MTEPLQPVGPQSVMDGAGPGTASSVAGAGATFIRLSSEPACSGPSTGPRPPQGSGRRQRPLLRCWLGAFAVLVVIEAAWVFATPLGSAPDEPAHLLRAASLVRGQLLGTPLSRPSNADKSMVTVKVPEIFAYLAHDIPCFQVHPAVPAGCEQQLAGPTNDITIADYVGRYPPFYYALVGLPTLALVSAKGGYGARLVSGALAAAMLALAVTSLRRCRGSPLLGAGLALAMTPMALYLGASINPNGLEVAAAISAWVAAMALASQAPKDVSASSSGALGISVVVLILTRAISPLWCKAQAK